MTIRYVPDVNTLPVKWARCAQPREIQPLSWRELLVHCLKTPEGRELLAHVMARVWRFGADFAGVPETLKAIERNLRK